MGKTQDKDKLLAKLEKHPHARGEDQNVARNLLKSEETPPRTWGRQYLIPNIKTDDRNTPTHVGKTP